MAADYIPEKDGDAAHWMNWFSYRLACYPEVYRTTPEYAEQLVAAAGAYSGAYMDASHPGNKCKSLVRAKNNSRKAAERLIRPEAQRVRVDPQISNEMKVLIGITPRRKRRRTVPVPDSVPVLNICPADFSGVVRINVSDSRTLRPARPTGAVGMQLYERITPRAILEAQRGELTQEQAAAFRFVGLFTRTPIRLVPALTGRGDQVCYVGRWVTARGKTSRLGEAVATYPHFNPVSRDVMSMARERRVA